MKHSLKTKILIGVPAVFIIVMVAVIIVITTIHSKQSRKEADTLLGNSFSIIRYTITEKEKDLIDDFQQTASLNDMGGMIKYVTDNKPFFKYGIMRPTYIKIADLIHNTNIIADIYRTCIYDMNGELIAFSINGERLSTSGYIYNLENIEIAALKAGEELTYESWHRQDDLPAGVESSLGRTIPDEETVEFKIIDNMLCLAAYIPVMGKDYNPVTEKMETKQVGLASVIQNFDTDFAGKMSELSGTNIDIHTRGAVVSADLLDNYKTFNLDGFEDIQSGWTLDKQPLIFKDIDIAGKDYYSAILPVYSGSRCIAAIAARYSKNNFHANTSQIIKLLSVIYFIGIIIIVPVTILFVIRGIINPIKKIAAMMRQIADKKDFTKMLNVERDDEIGELATSFNDMTENLQKTTTSIDNLNHEITERQKVEEEMKKLNEELENANEEMKNFVYIASHDLREPLRKITSFGGMLEKSIKAKLDSSDDAENLHFMIDGAQRMSQMIDGLLSYSRVSTQGHVFEDVQIGNIINELKQFELGALLDDTHTIIEVLQPLPTVKADPVQMRQLIQNLIANGIKYQAKGNTPHITITSKPAANEMVRIEITDNGIGIKPEYLGTVFTMFKRLHSRSEYEGTGIGLSVCKKIVERHGGQIGIESEFGKGTTFWFTVPADKALNCAAVS